MKQVSKAVENINALTQSAAPLQSRCRQSPNSYPHRTGVAGPDVAVQDRGRRDERSWDAHHPHAGTTAFLSPKAPSWPEEDLGPTTGTSAVFLAVAKEVATRKVGVSRVVRLDDVQRRQLEAFARSRSLQHELFRVYATTASRNVDALKES
jgi:hypothetical protein